MTIATTTVIANCKFTSE